MTIPALPGSPLAALRALVPPRRSAPLHSSANRAANPSETREKLFILLSRLAHRHGLHAAPCVAPSCLAGVRHGQAQGLSHQRIDVLLLTRSAQPVLALDHAPDGRLSRADRHRLAARTRLFERSGLALLLLHGLPDWDTDCIIIDQYLSDLLGAPAAVRNQPPHRR